MPDIYIQENWSPKKGYDWYAFGEKGWEDDLRSAGEACELTGTGHVIRSLV